MAKKPKHAEHVNLERWLVSYADFITLLFAFFTSLYAISMMEASKQGKMVFSTRAAFNMDFFKTKTPVLGASSQQQDDFNIGANLKRKPKAEKKKKLVQKHKLRLRKLARELENHIAHKNLADHIKVRTTRNGITISLREAGFFGPGSAEVRQESLPVLDMIAEKLVRIGQPVRVEGHTDDQPTKSSRKGFRSNWELSSARAINVVSYLVEEFAYPADRLSAAGYSSFRPIASNETPEGRSLNRRVDLVLVNTPPLNFASLRNP